MRGGRLPGRGQACPVRFGGAKLLAAVCGFPLAAVASGCAGTPWGERLSGSFPPPPDAQPGIQLPNSQPPSGQRPGASPLGSPPEAGTKPQGLNLPAASPPSPPGAPSPRPAASGPTARAVATPTPKGATSPQPPAPKAAPSPSPSTPFPYRVTLRLPRADPSAPAEAVTRALRAAGIPFEVETIERVKGGAPQGLEGSTGGPSVRPAPPPR